jgi:hypothetical protein
MTMDTVLMYSGVIAALVNNNLGISGISKENNVKVMPHKSSNSDGSLQLIDIIRSYKLCYCAQC